MLDNSKNNPAQIPEGIFSNYKKTYNYISLLTFDISLI